MPEYDPDEFVRMTHPTVDTVSGRVTRQAFEEVHKAKGWKIASAEDAEAADVAEASGEAVALKAKTLSTTSAAK